MQNFINMFGSRKTAVYKMHKFDMFSFFGSVQYNMWLIHRVSKNCASVIFWI